MARKKTILEQTIHEKQRHIKVMRCWTYKTKEDRRAFLIIYRKGDPENYTYHQRTIEPGNKHEVGVSRVDLPKLIKRIAKRKYRRVI